MLIKCVLLLVSYIAHWCIFYFSIPHAIFRCKSQNSNNTFKLCSLIEGEEDGDNDTVEGAGDLGLAEDDADGESLAAQENFIEMSFCKFIRTDDACTMCEGMCKLRLTCSASI